MVHFEVEFTIELKPSGACFVDDPEGIAFELRKQLLEGIIVWSG